MQLSGVNLRRYFVSIGSWQAFALLLRHSVHLIGQCNSRQAIRLATSAFHTKIRRAGYFQQVLPDGLVEVGMWGGAVVVVQPLDVCDVLPGEPIKVRAMKHRAWLEWVALPPHAAQRTRPHPEAYEEAYVLRASLCRSGRLHSVRTVACDGSAPPRSVPLHDHDWCAMAKLPLDRLMPVQKSGRQWSAGSASMGVARAQRGDALVAQALMASALRSDARAVQELADHGWKPLPQSRVRARCKG